MALRESAGFHNGAVWQAPNDLRIVLTWLDDNQWALMSEPERSRHRGYCVIPHSDINGQWLWEGNQLAARLDGWTYLPDQSLGPLISKSVAAPVPAREWWRHAETGGVYEVIVPTAWLEWNAIACVVYRGELGRTWVRPCSEFHDGRFERVPPPAADK